MFPLTLVSRDANWFVTGQAGRPQRFTAGKPAQIKDWSHPSSSSEPEPSDSRERCQMVPSVGRQTACNVQNVLERYQSDSNELNYDGKIKIKRRNVVIWVNTQTDRSSVLYVDSYTYRTEPGPDGLHFTSGLLRFCRICLSVSLEAKKRVQPRFRYCEEEKPQKKKMSCTLF